MRSRSQWKWTLLTAVLSVGPGVGQHTAWSAPTKVIVTDFLAADTATSHLVTQIVRLYIGSSDALDCVSTEKVQGALAVLNVSNADTLTNQQVSELARRIGLQAGYVVRGKCNNADGTLTIDADVIAFSDGVTRPLGQDRVFGPSENDAYLARQLANLLHYRMTGRWLNGIDSEKMTSKDIGFLERSDPVAALEHTKNDIKLSVSLNAPGEQPSYQPKEHMTIRVRPDHDCYLAIYNVDTHGEVRALFPNTYVKDNHVAKDHEVLIPPPGADWEFVVKGDPGEEQILVFASEQQSAFPGLDEIKREFCPTVSKGINEFVNGSPNAPSKGVYIQLKAVPSTGAGNPASAKPWSFRAKRFYITSSKGIRPRVGPPHPDTVHNQ